MQFKLFYKGYDYKVTWSAKRDFKRETGRGLWPTLMGVINVMHENKDSSVLKRLEEVSKHIDDIDGAILLWCLAKQCNSMLTLNEISDACDRSGWRPVSEDGDYAQPYTYILYMLALEVDKMYQEEAIQAKKDLCHSKEEPS